MIDADPCRLVPAHADPAADDVREACGVFAVYGPSRPVAQLTYLGLFALQHRGQEAAGMAVSDGDTLTVIKDQGLVASVFDDRTLAGLTGHLAIGHCRYSTTGSSTWRNAQPAYRSVGEHAFALGHNGNLVNTEQLVREAGMLDGTVTSDSDLVAELVAGELARNPAPAAPPGGASGASGNGRSPDEPSPAIDAHGAGDAGSAGPAGDAGDAADPAGLCRLGVAVAAVARMLQGAFSLVLMDDSCVMGLRDPHGFRPLCLGQLDGGGWVLASETPALDIVGAHFVRELDAGEMVVIDGDGPDDVHSLRPWPPEAVDRRLCLFEFVYFSRPDSQLYGRNVHQARVRMGEQLAEQAPVDADMVMGVPESGVPAAEGYARRSGIPLGQGLVKNRYVGRSFIAPSQELRARAVRMKLNPLRENIAGKRLVVIDDTIVRGTTQKQLVKMLREAGAREVHLRITSPPVKWSCFYGIDTGERSELIAANMDVEQLRHDFEVDTLAYLTLDRLVAATGVPGEDFCDACFTGDYPVPVPVTLRKHVLEQNQQRFEEDIMQPALDGSAV